MLSPYRKLLAAPSHRKFAFWGLVMRVPMGLTGLGTLLLVQIEYDSYTLGGTVIAVLAISSALVAPQVGRLVDRYGQSRVLRIGITISVCARVALIGAALSHVSPWILFCLAPLVPAHGTLSTYSRARWSHLLRCPNEVNTAFSLEGSLDEIIFIAGPALATVLATTVASWSGAGLAVLTLIVGGWQFIKLSDTEPPPLVSNSVRPANTARAKSSRRRNHLLATTPALVITTIVFLTQGVLFASVDLATVSFAEQLGQKQWSGLVLATFAAGSLLGGLAYGARMWRHTLATRLFWGVTFTGIGAALFGLAPNLVVLAVIMGFTGLAVAPTMAIGDGVVQALVPRHRVTEGMTWTRTGIELGIAGGAFAAGLAVDHHGATGAFHIAGVAGLIGILVTATAWPYIRRQKRYVEVVD